MLLSIVVPVYKEEKNIPEFLRRVTPIIQAITPDYEIIFSLDPSPDRTEEVILEARAKDERIKLLKFSRRFGQPMATIAGLQYSSGDAVVALDVDLQDPPELITQMVEKWRGGFDVVMAQRKSREGETLVKRVVSWVGYRLINRIANVNIPPNTGDFRLMSRRVVNEVVKLRECHGFLRGLVALVGFKQTTILFDRPPRFSGAGNYNRFLGSLRIGMNGIVGFSTQLLSLATTMGFLSAITAFILGVVSFALKVSEAMGWLPLHIVPGQAAIIVLILFVGGIQLITIGILGEYIGRIYEEVRQRPKFIVDRAEGWENQRNRDVADE